MLASLLLHEPVSSTMLLVTTWWWLRCRRQALRLKPLLSGPPHTSCPTGIRFRPPENFAIWFRIVKLPPQGRTGGFRLN